MSKTYKPLTNAFSAYLKSTIKKGEFLSIAGAEDGYIYFLNGYIGGRIHSVFYADLLQPVTLREAPAPGQHINISGNRPNFTASEIVGNVQKNIESADASAQDTGFKIKLPASVKENYGNIIRIKGTETVGAVVNEVYCNMLDSSGAWILRGHGIYSPVVASLPDQMDIIIMPMRISPEKRDAVDAIASIPVFDC